MARSESSVIWTIVAVVGAGLLAAAVLFGPRLWREGRALVGPIAELTLERYSAIHSALREPGGGGINVQVKTGD